MLVDLQCWDAGDDDAPKRIADDGRWSLTDSNTHLQFGCCWRRDVPAGVVKSVDTQDLGSCDESRGFKSLRPHHPNQYCFGAELFRRLGRPADFASAQFSIRHVSHASHRNRN